MPQFVENGAPNGTLDSVQFDGVDDSLNNTAGSGGIFSNRAFAMFFVVKLPPPGGSADEIMFSYKNSFAFGPSLTFRKLGGSNTLRLSRLDNGARIDMPEVGGAGGWTLGSWVVLSIRRNDASRVDVYINGVYQATRTSTIGPGGWDLSGISFGDSAGATNLPGNCEIAAVVTYEGQKTPADVRGMEQFLGDKYGIVIEPAAPPFASGFFDFYAEAGANRLMQGYDNSISQSEPEGLKYNDIVGHWTDTTTNVTSLTIESDVTNGIPAGSRFGLYKIDQTP